MVWIGWLLCTEKGFWEKVCQEEGLDNCSHRLGEIAGERGIKESLCVLTGGSAPSFRPSGIAPVRRSTYKTTR
jgi:hypothetical protein